MHFATRLLRLGAFDCAHSIGLVPCAIGGSCMDEWQPGSPHYEQMVRLSSLLPQFNQLAVAAASLQAQCLP